jgi:hypothetical protein
MNKIRDIRLSRRAELLEEALTAWNKISDMSDAGKSAKEIDQMEIVATSLENHASALYELAWTESESVLFAHLDELTGATEPLQNVIDLASDLGTHMIISGGDVLEIAPYQSSLKDDELPF